MRETSIIAFDEAIIATVAFFDVFERPLTAFEIWKYLYKVKAEYMDVLRSLGHLLEGNKLEEKEGMYFLPGKNNSVRQRHNRYVLAEYKFKIAIRAARVISRVPGVRFIGVCNSLAFSNAREKSDIDFFIITENGRLYLTRLMVTLIIQLLGLRRHHDKVSNRVCLSFYVTREECDMRPLLLPGVDIYFHYWIQSLVPLYNSHRTFEDFVEKNSWVKQWFPRYSPKMIFGKRAVKGTGIWYRAKHLLEKATAGDLGDRLEKRAKRFQRKKMSKKSGSISSLPDTRVIVSDSVLKFHEQDRRIFYHDLWEERLKRNLPSRLSPQ